MKHENNGKCDRCAQVFDRYPGFHAELRKWFESLQKDHPEAHISCAGRGADEQENLFNKRATRARYGQSAHNYNAAIDIFENGGDLKDIYEINWFKVIIGPRIPDWLEWYGVPGSKFYELPHVQVKDWRFKMAMGKMKPVEDVS